MDPLVVVDDLAAFLQRDLDRASADLAVAGASGAVRAFCRWPISQVATTFLVDATGNPLVALPTMRLVDITAVRIGGDVLDPSAYQWNESGLLSLWGRTQVPRRFRWIEVDCTHGYAPSEMPDEIRQVVLCMAARNMSNPENLQAKTVGTAQRRFATIGAGALGVGELASGEKNLIAGYRLP